MTKAAIWKEIKSKLNATEIETLGISGKSSIEKLQEVYDQVITIIKSSELTEETSLPTGRQGLHVVKDEESEKPDSLAEEITSGKEAQNADAGTSDAGTSDDFDELLGRIEGSEPGQAKDKKDQPLITKEKRKRKPKESSPDAFHVEGYILLLATDTVFPTLLAFINNMIDKKHRKIESSELQLAQKDFDKLEPLANQAADYMTVHLNPIAGFFLVSAFMYTNNVIAAKSSDPDPVKLKVV